MSNSEVARGAFLKWKRVAIEKRAEAETSALNSPVRFDAQGVTNYAIGFAKALWLMDVISDVEYHSFYADLYC